MRVNFEMDRTDIRGFLEKNFEKRSVTRYDDPVLSVEKRRSIVGEMFHPPMKPLDWWHPESVERFIVVIGSANLVIGLDDPKRADIWMYWTH